MDLYFYDVEFVFEHMVILVNVGFPTPPDELEDTDEFVIEQASQTLINNYKQSRASERKKILGFTELLVKSFSNDLVGFKKARGYALTLLDISRPIKQSFVRKMSYGE